MHKQLKCNIFWNIFAKMPTEYPNRLSNLPHRCIHMIDADGRVSFNHTKGFPSSQSFDRFKVDP